MLATQRAMRHNIVYGLKKPKLTRILESQKTARTGADAYMVVKQWQETLTKCDPMVLETGRAAHDGCGGSGFLYRM